MKLDPSTRSNEYIRVFDDYIELIIPQNGDGYDIGTSRMNTRKKVEDWVEQLSPKRWISQGHIDAFLKEASRLGVDCSGIEMTLRWRVKHED